MSGNYGTQVIESVAVRRRRLREAWLFGAERAKNTLNEQTGKVFASIMIAAVACAGCAGVSVLQVLAGQGEAEPAAHADRDHVRPGQPVTERSRPTGRTGGAATSAGAVVSMRPGVRRWAAWPA